jgi:hypothetical protein
MKTRLNELFVLMAVMVLFPAASFADTRGGGAGTTANITLDAVVNEATDNWDTLLSKSVTLTSTSQCIVTACSDIDNPGPIGSVSNNYIFVISLDDTSPGLNTSSERALEMNDSGADEDPVSDAVCSTRHVSVPAGTHTIRWLGARVSTSDDITTVLDTSLTVGCFSGSAL